MAAERGRRRWSVEDLAQRAGLSARTVEYIESGLRMRYRDTTLGRLEDAFGWPPGTALRIVDGGEPYEDADELLARVGARWPYLTPDERQAIVDLVDMFTRQA